jgi:hypothetical protein
LFDRKLEADFVVIIYKEEYDKIFPPPEQAGQDETFEMVCNSSGGQ